MATKNEAGIQKNDTVVIFHMANPETMEDTIASRIGGHRFATVTHVTKHQYTAEGIRFWNNGNPVKLPEEPVQTETDARGRVAYVEAVHPAYASWTRMDYADHAALVQG